MQKVYFPQVFFVFQHIDFVILKQCCFIFRGYKNHVSPWLQKRTLFCSWDSCTFSQTMTVAFKLRLYIWLVNFLKIGFICVWCCEFFSNFGHAIARIRRNERKIRSFCIILKSIFVCLLDFVNASLLQVREKNLQDSNKDSIQHFKTAFLEKCLCLYLASEKKIRAFLSSVFFFVVYKEK